jgi:hypothetical protein
MPLRDAVHGGGDLVERRIPRNLFPPRIGIALGRVRRNGRFSLPL